MKRRPNEQHFKQTFSVNNTFTEFLHTPNWNGVNEIDEKQVIVITESSDRAFHVDS